MKEAKVITEFLPVSDREKQYVFTLGKKTVKDEKKKAKLVKCYVGFQIFASVTLTITPIFSEWPQDLKELAVPDIQNAESGGKP